MKAPLEAAPGSHNLKQLSDKELLGLYKAAKNDEALAEQRFNVIYNRHALSAWHFIRYKTQSVEDAEDVFVDTWHKAIEGMSRLNLKTNFRGWLIGIARHNIAGYYLTRKVGLYTEVQVQPGTKKSISSEYSLDELLFSLNGEFGVLLETFQAGDRHR
ncbi:MAG: sigma-70 family RNA polymerase sigma factor, partial [Deltaproteobacteria bacterium]|nr:sigma-70 family RNA polymerase sigma factor [Deltaproteobacteria bacterium]